MTYEEKILGETISKLEDHLLPEYGQKFDPETRKVVKKMLKKVYDTAFKNGQEMSNTLSRWIWKIQRFFIYLHRKINV